MKPRLTLLLLAASVATGYGVYQVKYEVRELRQKAAVLEAEIAEEQAAIEVLKAEWAYLTRPTRIERLAESHLDLQPLSPGQIVAIDDLGRHLSPPDTIARNAAAVARFAAVGGGVR